MLDQEKFHVTTTLGDVDVKMERSTVNGGLAKFTLDGNTIRAKLDEFLKGVIESRCEDLDLDDRIKQALDRRIEVAVNAVAGRLQAEIAKTATDYALARIKEQIDAVPIAVAVSVKAGEQESRA